MKDISLKDLLEAGCHFGHKTDKWHPKASVFIYAAREKLHIIDLAKTKAGLTKAAEFVYSLGKEGKVLLMVATKRQAKTVVYEAAKKAGVVYLTNRWVGGFMTNWDSVKKNIDKVNRMKTERTDGAWSKFPKHEQVKLEKELRKMEMVYGGVLNLVKLPDAIFIVDIRREDIALKESIRAGITSIAIVDTNANPEMVDFAIPANDDAVGSVKFIVDYLAEAYTEGLNLRDKEAEISVKREAESGKEEKREEKVNVDAKGAKEAIQREKVEKAKSEGKSTKKEKPKKEKTVKKAQKS